MRQLKLDRVQEFLLVLGIFIELLNFFEFVQKILIEDVPHNLPWVVSNKSRLNEGFLVVNWVDELERIQESSLHVDLIYQGLLVHLELDPTLLVKLVQLFKAEPVETGFR